MDDKRKEYEKIADMRNWYANEIADMRQDCETKWWVYDRFSAKLHWLNERYYKLQEELGITNEPA